MRIALRVLAATLLLTAALPAQKRVITHEDVWMLKRTGEPVVSPDGKWVVFSLVEPDYDPAKQVSDLWIVPTDGSTQPRRLTSSRGAESSPDWAPDSKRIAFSARREGDETAQIYVLSVQGGEAQRVTNISTGASNPQWRPDGNAILFESMVYPGSRNDEDNKRIAAERRARKYNARVFDTFPIRFWNTWLDDRVAHIWVQDLNTPGASPRDLLAGTQLAALPGFSGLANPLGGDQTLKAIWSPDGRLVIFAAVTNREETMWAETESHLFAVQASGGREPIRLTPKGHSYNNPKISGEALYATQDRSPVRGGPIYSISRLVRFVREGEGASAPQVLTAGWDRSVGDYSVAPDGAIYIAAEDDGFDKLFRLKPGGKPELLFEVKAGGYTNPVADGGVLVARYGASTQPPEIAVIDAARGTHRLLSNFNADRLAQLELPPPEHFWFTAKNGKRIHNLIQFPPNLDRSKKYPLVVFPHGGPNSMSKDAFSTRWNNHLLTAPGYVLLQTNYTGSTGFGEKFADDIEKDVLRGPVNECLEAIEEAIKRYPFIDRTRQAAIGASYGGYIMNWLNGHTNQFRAFVNHAGAVNNESQYGTNDGGLSRELRMGVPIWETGGQWNDQSPIRYSGKWQTPTLITQGELDFRVPLSESMTTFKILQRRRIPARLVLFPEEGHWILRGENNKLHMQEVMGWLKKYLEPEQPVFRPAAE